MFFFFVCSCCRSFRPKLAMYTRMYRSRSYVKVWQYSYQFALSSSRCVWMDGSQVGELPTVCVCVCERERERERESRAMIAASAHLLSSPANSQLVRT